MEKNKSRLNGIIGSFCYHLMDTHGIPKQLFEEKYLHNGYWDFDRIRKIMLKHRDFLKKVNNNG